MRIPICSSFLLIQSYPKFSIDLDLIRNKYLKIKT